MGKRETEEMKIYRIRNLINNKVYIGKSKDPEHRWSQHQKAAELGSDLLFHRAIRKYGVDSFELETILECDGDGTEEERSAIVENDCCILDGVDKGYNMTRGGDGFDSESTSFYLKKAAEEGVNPFCKGNVGNLASIKAQEERIRQGKHNFQNEEHRKKISELQKRRVEEGVHPLAGERGSKHSKELQRRRIAEGTFHSLQPEMKAHLSAKQKELIARGLHNTSEMLLCPHCGTTGKGPIMKRWHMDNCKKK